MMVYDLFCGAGGVGLTLSKLGIEHIGIDIEDHSETYSGEFIHADATHPPLAPNPDLLWLSPPCLAYTTLSAVNASRYGWNETPRERYPTFSDLGIRKIICELDPDEYIIENVAACGDLSDPTFVEGTAFGKPYRMRRAFETSFPVPDAVGGAKPTVTFSGPSATNTTSHVAAMADAKGVPRDWGEQSVNSAIPREYTQYLLHYCPSAPKVGLPDGAGSRQSLLMEVGE